MKSAEALLQARGMFHSTAIRMRACTSVSCETGVRGSKKKIRKSMSPSLIFPPICRSPPQRTVQERANLQAEFVLQLFAGRSRGEQLVVGQTLFVVFGPLDQVALGVVVSQEGYPLLPCHRKGFTFHAACCLLFAEPMNFSKIVGLE